MAALRREARRRAHAATRSGHGAAQSGPRSPDSSSGDLFAATGMITVGPSSLDKPSYRRWCLEESDEYITDVILECKSRFHIDPDRVFLSATRWAASARIRRPCGCPTASQPSWPTAARGDWLLARPRGTPLGFVNGVHDARPGVRNHSTDVDYGRLTDQTPHPRAPRTHVLRARRRARLFRGTQVRLRLPAQHERPPPRSLLRSHRPGESERFSRVRTLPRDGQWLADVGQDRAGQHRLRRAVPTTSGHVYQLAAGRTTSPRCRGASLDAVNRHDNTILVAARNVASFTVWLHPPWSNLEAGDDRGKRHSELSGPAQPSLATAMESYDRRHDWGMIYPMKVVIDLTAR